MVKSPILSLFAISLLEKFSYYNTLLQLSCVGSIYIFVWNKI